MVDTCRYCVAGKLWQALKLVNQSSESMHWRILNLVIVSTSVQCNSELIYLQCFRVDFLNNFGNSS